MQHAGVQTDWDAADVELGRLENMDWGALGGYAVGDEGSDDDDDDFNHRTGASPKFERFGQVSLHPVCTLHEERGLGFCYGGRRMRPPAPHAPPTTPQQRHHPPLAHSNVAAQTRRTPGSPSSEACSGVTAAGGVCLQVVAAERLNRAAPTAHPLPPPRHPAAARAASFLTLSAAVRTQLEGAMRDVLSRSVAVGLPPVFLWNKDDAAGATEEAAAAEGVGEASVPVR
jgi:hypothetical protein